MKKYIKLFLFIFITLTAPITFCLSQTSTSEVDSEPIPQQDKFTPQHESLPVKEGVILQDEDKPDEDVKKHEIESYLTFLPSTKSKDENSRVSIIESEFDYSYEYKFFDKIPVTFSLSSEYIDIKEDSRINLPSHLTGISAGIDVVLPFFNLDKTYINLGVSPSIYRDDWRFKTSSFRMPTNTFLIYKPDDKWVFVGGLAFFPDFKDKFFPILGFVYKPNEKLIFNITTDDPSIAYSPNDKLTIFAQMELPLGAEFEVTNGDSKNMVLIYNDMRLGLGLGYKINKFISVTIAGGGVFDRYIRYRDVDGKLSIKNGGYGEFSIDIQI
ncbi:MAG: DUF6268 family outer membrane beta-barrel protein [Candidatus Omnitrophica bacterium]|jgi:hypothetical protein|nr:DUF6268 family outer membrane beta-barrel protein [Candidatus Omnitrophota bacterium]